MRDLMERAMKEWTAARRVSVNRTLVVFIDDLDRCPPVNVLQIFEAVKLYLNASGLIFVIGYDPAVVSEFSDPFYLEQYSDSITNYYYVDKSCRSSTGFQMSDTMKPKGS